MRRPAIYDAPMWWVVVAVVVVVAVAIYLTWLAARVDRLHLRAATAGKALDAHLVRRAAAAAVLAEERLLPELYAAARAALDAGPEEREAAENDLTRRLRGVSLPAADAGWAPVVEASRRVALTRQVHSDLVRDARALRGRPVVRIAGLARRHPQPAYFDVDDPTLDGTRPSHEVT